MLSYELLAEIATTLETINNYQCLIYARNMIYENKFKADFGVAFFSNLFHVLFFGDDTESADDANSSDKLKERVTHP